MTGSEQLQRRSLAFDQRGAALVEFALVAPLLLTLLMGIVAYGGWFWRAHLLQQIANDSARAALAGLTASERATLAQTTAAGELATLAELPAGQTTVSVQESGSLVSVALSYDGSHDAFLALPFVPLPGKTVRRTATVRLGGL